MIRTRARGAAPVAVAGGGGLPGPPTVTGRTGLTPDGRLRSGRLAGLTMAGAMWTVAWPVLIESFLTSLVGLTDTVMAAGLSEAATDAVAGASYILWFIGLITMAIGVGATALVSRSIGAGRRAVADAALGQALLMAVVSGVATGVLVGVAAGPVARAMHMSPAAAAHFREFLGILAFSVPASTVLFAGLACSRGAGDTVRPLWTMAIVNLVNIAASWGFSGVDVTGTRTVSGEAVRVVLLENPLGFDLGVRGIALGTLAAHVVGVLTILAFHARRASGLRLRARRLRPHGATLGRLVRVGIPNFLETSGMWIGNLLVIFMVGWLGRDGLLGAHIVAVRIESFSYLPGFALGAACAALVGQYLGAGAPHLARAAALRSVVLAGGIMGLMGVLFVTCAGALVRLFTAQPIHLAETPALLALTGFIQVPFAAAIVMRAAMHGAGDVRAAMLLTWVSTYGVRLPLVYLLSGVRLPLPGGGSIPSPLGLEPSLYGVWIALCIEVVVRFGLYGARFAGGRWLRARV